MLAEAASNLTGEAILGTVALVLAIVGKVLAGKYRRVWQTLQLVAVAIELAGKDGTTVENNAAAIKEAIASMTQAKPEGEIAHKAARQAEAAVLTMKPVP
jgi:hypothetical protein